jgi:hypothetical protein
MGVLQVTVQHAAGSEGRGAASSIVQFSRSLGAASGTLIVSTALFLGLANADATILSNFRLLLEQGPAALSPLALESRREIIAVLLTGFRDAFAVIALLTSLASVAAWTTPLRRIYQADQTK